MLLCLFIPVSFCVSLAANTIFVNNRVKSSYPSARDSEFVYYSTHLHINDIVLTSTLHSCLRSSALAATFCDNVPTQSGCSYFLFVLYVLLVVVWIQLGAKHILAFLRL